MRAQIHFASACVGNLVLDSLLPLLHREFLDRFRSKYLSAFCEIIRYCFQVILDLQRVQIIHPR